MLSRSALAARLNEARKHSSTVVFTSGSFEALNLDHLRALQRARAQGDLLVVAVREGGTAGQRAELLAALRFVDYVTVFSGKTPARLIRALRPDVVA